MAFCLALGMVAGFVAAFVGDAVAVTYRRRRFDRHVRDALAVAGPEAGSR